MNENGRERYEIYAKKSAHRHQQSVANGHIFALALDKNNERNILNFFFRFY